MIHKCRHSIVRWVMVAVVLGVAGSTFVACGSPSAAPLHIGASDPVPRTRVQVGKTILLDVSAHGPGPWALSYPRSLMTLTEAARDKGQFHLLARRPGVARILAWPLGACGYPALHGPARKCPMVQVDQRVTRPIVVTVEIVR